MKEKYGLLREVERNPSIIENTSRRIKNALNVEIKMEMEISALMNSKERNTFLHASGYKTSEKRCSSAINVFEFCQVVQEYQQRYCPEDQNQFVSDFLAEVDRQITEEDFEKVIEDLAVDKDEVNRIEAIGEESALDQKIQEEKEMQK